MGDAGRTAMGNLGQYSPSGAGGQRSMAELVRDVIGDVQAIMRSEVTLARVETREELARAASASKLLVIGALMALFAVVFALVCVYQALCLVMAPWLAALVMFVVLGAVAGGMAAAGIARWKTFHAVPPKTTETVKENLEWARNQTKS